MSVAEVIVRRVSCRAYRPDPVPDFATNGVMLVTAYEGGYAITNAYCFTAGSLSEPQIEFSVSCPEVMFLNDDPVVTNYLERVYRVSLSLRAPEGVVHYVSSFRRTKPASRPSNGRNARQNTWHSWRIGFTARVNH